MNKPNLKSLITRYEANKRLLERHSDKKEIIEKFIQKTEKDIIEYVTSEGFKETLKYLNL